MVAVEWWFEITPKRLLLPPIASMQEEQSLVPPSWSEPEGAPMPKSVLGEEGSNESYLS